MWNASSAEVARQIFDQPSPVVVVKPVLQIMKSRKIFAGTNAAAVTIHLDVMQKLFRSPVSLRFIQHASEAERGFEKCPAIHSVKVHRRRLDPVVDLECEMPVTSAKKRYSHCGCSFADRQRSPIFLFCLCYQPVELLMALENRAER